MRSLVVALVVAAVALPAQAARPPFTPRTIAGTWVGSWTNIDLGSEGNAKLVARSLAKNAKMLFTADLGSVFGCSGLSPETPKPLVNGKGPNRWNGNGFRIRGTSKALGSFDLVYTHRSRALRGGGSNPLCAQGLAWRVEGTFAVRMFTGVVHMYLRDGTHVESLLTLTRR